MPSQSSCTLEGSSSCLATAGSQEQKSNTCSAGSPQHSLIQSVSLLLLCLHCPDHCVACCCVASEGPPRHSQACTQSNTKSSNQHNHTTWCFGSTLSHHQLVGMQTKTPHGWWTVLNESTVKATFQQMGFARLISPSMEMLVSGVRPP